MAEEVQVTEVTVKTKTEKVTSGAELNISALNPDADGDGNVSPLEMEIYKALKAADIDGSGSIGTGELYSVIGSLVEEKRKVKSLSKLVVALILVIILALASIFVVSMIAGETIKESHVDGGSVQVDKTGVAVGSATAVEAHGLWSLPSLSVEVLGNFQALKFYIDMTTSPDVGGWTVASTRPTTMYKKAAEKLVLVTSEGFKIDIDAKAKVGSIQMNGATYPIAEEAPPVSRRSLEELMEPPNQAAPPMRRRRLRRGGLSTQGSFTMTAGSNDNLTGDGR